MAIKFAEGDPEGVKRQQQGLDQNLNNNMSLLSLDEEAQGETVSKESSKKRSCSPDSGYYSISPLYIMSRIDQYLASPQMPAPGDIPNIASNIEGPEPRSHAANPIRGTLGVGYDEFFGTNVLANSYIEPENVASSPRKEYRNQGGLLGVLQKVESTRTDAQSRGLGTARSKHTGFGSNEHANGRRDLGAHKFRVAEGGIAHSKPALRAPWRARSLLKKGDTSKTCRLSSTLPKLQSNTLTPNSTEPKRKHEMLQLKKEEASKTCKLSSTSPKLQLNTISPNSIEPKRKHDILQLKSWREAYISAPAPSSEHVDIPDDATIEHAAQALIVAVPENVQSVAQAVYVQQQLVEERLGRGTLQAFRPSFSALQTVGLLSGLDTVRSTISSNEYGGSENYLGDMAIPYNRSANIPDNQNCSLWILGLPADVTYNALLGSIRNVGKVFATVINPSSSVHVAAAAKLVFFERSSALKLLNMIMAGNFEVLGQQIVNARWNKIKSGPYANTKHSRAIRITGPAHLMDFKFFETFFKGRFTYNLDKKFMVPCLVDGLITHEWHFGSVRCQATSAKTAIEREYLHIFDVQWARDPCDYS